HGSAPPTVSCCSPTLWLPASRRTATEDSADSLGFARLKRRLAKEGNCGGPKPTNQVQADGAASLRGALPGPRVFICLRPAVRGQSSRAPGGISVRWSAPAARRAPTTRRPLSPYRLERLSR